MASAVYLVDHVSTGYNYGVPSLEVAEGSPHTTPRRRKNKNGTSRIRVCVRKRPLSKRESKRDKDVMTVETDQRQISVKEEKLAVDLRKVTLVHKFQFDDVFPEDFSNKDVYERTIKLFVPFVVRGGKATCFAFGQTGAGKTHTLLGDSNGRGLYQFAAEDLFEMLKRERAGDSVIVWISYFEIYCGQLYDLLNKRERIQALEDYKHQVCIAGVNEIPVNGTHALVQYIERGHSVRSQGSSGVNPTSSRSHAVLQIQLKDVTGNKLGRLSVIDLAGSERACDRGDPDRATRLEGAEINTSLLSLKECIRAMDQEQLHTPFRQSKLTQVLRDSLLGESQTCMLASVSPSSSSLEDTLNTLRYADRVKEINKVKFSSGHTPRNFSPNSTSTPLKGQRGIQPPTMRRTSLPAQTLNQVKSRGDQKRRSSMQPSPTKSKRDTNGVGSGPMKTPKRKTVNSLERVNSRNAFHQKRNELNHGKKDSEVLPAVSFEVIDGNSLVMRDESIRKDNSLDKQKQELKKERGEMEAEDTAVDENGYDGSSNVKVIVTEYGGLNEVEDKRKLQSRMVENFLSNSLPIWEDEQLQRKKSHQHPPNLSFAWEVDNPHYLKSQEKTIKKSREKVSGKGESFAVFDYENPRYVDRKKETEISTRIVETESTEMENSDHYSKPGSQMSTEVAKAPVQSLIDDYEAHLTERRDEAGSPSSVATDSTMELLAEISQSLRNSSVSPVPDLESLDRISYTEPWNREGRSGKQGGEPGQREERSPTAGKHSGFKEMTRMESVNPRTKQQNGRKTNQIGECHKNYGGGKHNRKNDVQRRSKVAIEKESVTGNGGSHAVTNGSGLNGSPSGVTYHATDRTSHTEKVAVHHEYSQDRVADHRRGSSKQSSVKTGGFRYPEDERPSLNYFSPVEASKTEMRTKEESGRTGHHGNDRQGDMSNGVSRTNQSFKLAEHRKSLASPHDNEIESTNDKTRFTNDKHLLHKQEEVLKQMDDGTQRDGVFDAGWESEKVRKNGEQQKSVRQVDVPKVDQSPNYSVDDMVKIDQEETVTLVVRKRNENVHNDSSAGRDSLHHNKPHKGRLSGNTSVMEKNVSNNRGTLDDSEEVIAQYKHASVHHIGRNTDNRIAKDREESKETDRPKSHDILDFVNLVDRSPTEMFEPKLHKSHESGGWCECCSVSEQKQLWSHAESSNAQNDCKGAHEVSNHASADHDHRRRSSLQVGHQSSPTRRITRQRKSLPWLGAPRFDDDWENAVRRKAPNNLPNGDAGQGSQLFVSSVTFDVGGHSDTRKLRDLGVKDRDGVEASENAKKSGDKMLPQDYSGSDSNCDTSKDQVVSLAAGGESNCKEHNRRNKREVKKTEAGSLSIPQKDVQQCAGAPTTSPSNKPRLPDISIFSMGGYVPTVFSLSQIHPESTGTDAQHESSSHEPKKETKKKSLKDKMSEKGIESLPSPKGFPQRSGTSKRRKGEAEETGGQRGEMTTWLETAKSKNVEEGDNFKCASTNGPDGVTEEEEFTPKRAAFFRETLQPVSNQWQYVTVDGRSPVSKVRVTSPKENMSSKPLTCFVEIHESQSGDRHYNDIECSNHATDRLCSKPQHSSNELKVGKEQRVCSEEKASQREREITREDGERDEDNTRKEAGIVIHKERGREGSLINDTKEELMMGEKKMLQLRNSERIGLEEVCGDEGTIVRNAETGSMRVEDCQYEQSYDHQLQLEQQANSNIPLLDVDWIEERRLLTPIPEGKTEDETDGERKGDLADQNRPTSASDKAIVSTEGPSSSNPCTTSHLLVRAHQEQLEELQQLCDSGWSLINRLQLGEGDVSEYLTDSNVLMERQQRCIKTFKDQLNIYAHCSTADRVMTLEEPG